MLVGVAYIGFPFSKVGNYANYVYQQTL